MAVKRNALALVGGWSNARTTKKPRVTVRASAAEFRPVDSPSSPPEPVFLRDSYASTAFAELIDRSSHAAMARFTAGLSPDDVDRCLCGLGSASCAALPGKRLQLVEKALRKWLRFAQYAARRTVERDGMRGMH